MKLHRAVACGLLCGALLSTVNCGSSGGSCDAANCSGCCDSSGACRPGTAADACGKSGLSCSACGASQTCAMGACSTGGGTGTGGGSATGGGAATGGGISNGGGSATGGGSSAGGGSGSEPVVFNEICARGSDYLELYNTGSASKDLGGYAVADSLDDGGGVKLDSALTFPSGTSLASGGFLLVVLNLADAGVTFDCLDGGQSPCFGATFKVSNSRGEVVWLLDPGGNVVQQQLYPMNAVPSGSSYGRFPDGTGAFGQTKLTPGYANQQ